MCGVCGVRSECVECVCGVRSECVECECVE